MGASTFSQTPCQKIQNLDKIEMKSFNTLFYILLNILINIILKKQVQFTM